MPINVFIWCPVVNQGGGHRLLTQLANALGAHAGIGRLALATPQQEHAFLRQGGLDTKSVELVALEPPPPQEWLHRWLWQDQRILGLKGTRSLKHWLRGRTGRTHLARERSHLGQLLRGFDVFYAFWPLGTVLPEVSLPVVCTVHDAINFEFPELFGPAETNRLQPEMQAWLERSQRVTVSSHYTGQRLRRIFGNFAGQIRVVDFFAMPKDAQPGQNHDACRAFHLTPGYVLNAANITAVNASTAG